MITHDPGTDGHYISEQDRQAAGLPIFHKSTKSIGVTNGGTSYVQHITRLSFSQLSLQATQAVYFADFPTSFVSVDETADDDTILIFTKDSVTVHKGNDVLITCQDKPLLIGVRDEHGRYRMPLPQQKGQWQPKHPCAKVKQANSVYDLPSIKQAIKWMHTICRYPIKSTWLKAINAGNLLGGHCSQRKTSSNTTQRATKPTRAT